MQLPSWTLVAFAAVVSAQQGLPTDPVGQSVINVLATAIPQESISLALADPQAFSSELVSSLSAGNTPEWYKALPTDVKSALPSLYPASTAVATTPSETATPTPTPTHTPSSSDVTYSPVTSAAGTISASPTGGNSTSILTVSSATLSSGDPVGSEPPASSALTGGASYPTAAVGAGVAGAFGILGMLAL